MKRPALTPTGSRGDGFAARLLDAVAERRRLRLTLRRPRLGRMYAGRGYKRKTAKPPGVTPDGLLYVGPMLLWGVH